MVHFFFFYGSTTFLLFFPFFFLYFFKFLFGAIAFLLCLFSFSSLFSSKENPKRSVLLMVFFSLVDLKPKTAYFKRPRSIEVHFNILISHLSFLGSDVGIRHASRDDLKHVFCHPWRDVPEWSFNHFLIHVHHILLVSGKGLKQ